MTTNEKAVLRAIQNPQYIGYTPSFFGDYPPLKLTELLERTGLKMEEVVISVDDLVKKKVLREILRPPEWAIKGQDMPPFDFYAVGYGICDNVLAEHACSQL